jgi:hypothetical protein
VIKRGDQEIKEEMMAAVFAWEGRE